MKLLELVAKAFVIAVAVMVTTSPRMVAAPETSSDLPPAPTVVQTIPGITALVFQPQPIGTLVAKANQDTIQVFDKPGGEVTQTLSRSDITYNPENPLTFVVVSDQDGWLEVMLPVRPNESIGWIWSSDVSLSRNYMSIVTDLSDRELCVNVTKDISTCYPVAIGTAENPTPVGSFFIEAWLQVTDDPIFGPYQFVLSAYSETETTFLGGNGVIGVHGTNEPWLIGTAASHGCIRMNNADVTELINLGVTPGTPFTIQP